MDPVAHLLAGQDGVISRPQLLDTGLKPSDLARMLRRRELASVHDGVFVDHTGLLTWQQRAWAAVLFSWPAALSHVSALRAAEGPGRRGVDESCIHVAVASSRHLVAPDGVRVHRVTSFQGRVQWNKSPPRIGYDDAVLDHAAEATTELDAIARLADACGSRRTSAAQLLTTAASRSRLPRRAWLVGVLDDVASGTCSVLEHGYLERVERAHGLPTAHRQVSHRHGGSTVFRDAVYAAYSLNVELDGRLFHETTGARDRDLDRDLEAAVDGSETLRISYGQVFDRPCWTATRVGAVLARRGWRGSIRPCPSCPPSSA